jgi:mRNA-degrading endonuclease RelE of RelBE toxin-antitoxin system
MNDIEWTQKASRQLRKLPSEGQRDIVDAVETLRDWPLVRQVRALEGQPGYRLRVGRYRILFTIHDGVPRIIRVEEVKKRDEHTY